VKLLTPAEVAERLSVPLKTVYDWSYKLCALDGLPVMKLGRRVRVSEAALADLPRPRRFFFFSGEDSGS
jgi:excisionase family DNA binding protein